MLDLTLIFFDISTGEIFILLIVVFIVFGPSKIPEMSKKLGKGIYEIKRASNEIKREIDSEVRKMERDANIDIDLEPKKTVKKQATGKTEEKSDTNTTERESDPRSEESDNLPNPYLTEEKSNTESTENK